MAHYFLQNLWTKKPQTDQLTDQQTDCQMNQPTKRPVTLTYHTHEVFGVKSVQILTSDELLCQTGGMETIPLNSLSIWVSVAFRTFSNLTQVDMSSGICKNKLFC